MCRIEIFQIKLEYYWTIIWFFQKNCLELRKWMQYCINSNSESAPCLFSMSLATFFGAFTHLFKRLCPSVRPSVPLVWNAFVNPRRERILCLCWARLCYAFSALKQHSTACVAPQSLTLQLLDKPGSTWRLSLYKKNELQEASLLLLTINGRTNTSLFRDTRTHIKSYGNHGYNIRCGYVYIFSFEQASLYIEALSVCPSVGLKVFQIIGWRVTTPFFVAGNTADSVDLFVCWSHVNLSVRMAITTTAREKDNRVHGLVLSSIIFGASTCTVTTRYARSSIFFMPDFDFLKQGNDLRHWLIVSNNFSW